MNNEKLLLFCKYFASSIMYKPFENWNQNTHFYLSLCSGYTDRTNQKQHLFTALLQECQLASPSSR